MDHRAQTQRPVMYVIVIKNYMYRVARNTHGCLPVLPSRAVCRVTIVKQQSVDSRTTVQPLHSATDDDGRTTVFSLLHRTKRTHRVRILASTRLQAHCAQFVKHRARPVQL